MVGPVERGVGNAFVEVALVDDLQRFSDIEFNLQGLEGCVGQILDESLSQIVVRSLKGHFSQPTHVQDIRWVLQMPSGSRKNVKMRR